MFYINSAWHHSYILGWIQFLLGQTPLNAAAIDSAPELVFAFSLGWGCRDNSDAYWRRATHPFTPHSVLFTWSCALYFCASTKINKCVHRFPITCLNIAFILFLFLTTEKLFPASFDQIAICALVHSPCRKARSPRLNEGWPFSLNLSSAIDDCGVSVCFIKERWNYSWLQARYWILLKRFINIIMLYIDFLK